MKQAAVPLGNTINKKRKTDKNKLRRKCIRPVMKMEILYFQRSF
jgi:hypothetical protein